ncbi:MAG: prepilin-type N-terminal cleavage/methylation domain-containing protein [Planctomycetes bacterium]|nr:prepilin-type N-terminal cleavage/methylation domain-containing protein [Planctomycetota bacterium]
MNLSQKTARRSRSGFTLIEVIASATILVIGCLGLSAAITSSGRLSELTRERMLAHEAARAQMEQLENADFGGSFALYNSSKADDPSGPGTAPGPNFAVVGLNTQRDDADGFVGEVVFPTLGGLGQQLSENLFDSHIGMPRDLNGDGVVGAGAMTGAYVVLPVRVIVRWRGPAGNSSLEIDNVLMDRTR